MSKLFQYLNGDWTEEEFNETMQGLIDKGLAERVTADSVEWFKLTTVGETVSKHLDSDPTTKN